MVIKRCSYFHIIDSGIWIAPTTDINSIQESSIQWNLYLSSVIYELKFQYIKSIEITHWKWGLRYYGSHGTCSLYRNETIIVYSKT